MRWLVLDFETRSTVDLKSASTRRYASHPSTDILCIGLKWNDKPATCVVPTDGLVITDRTVPGDIATAIRERYPIIVHNLSFEHRIYYWICVVRLGWPPIPDELWVDTMASCSYYALPRSLEGASKALGLSHEKDMEGNRLIKQVCKPRRHGPNAVNEWVASGKSEDTMPVIWWEDTDRLERIYEYCKSDVEAQSELFERLGPLPEDRWREWSLDEKVNERGVPVDWSALYTAAGVITYSLSDYDRRFRELTKTDACPDGMVQTASQIKRMMDWCELKGYMMVSMSRTAIEEALARDLPGPVRQLLIMRRDSGKTSLGKLQTMLYLTDDDGRIRDSMAWHGAATGRKAGRGMQPHNFPRDCMSGSEAEEFHNLLRSDNPGEAILHRYKQSDSIPTVVSSALRSFIKAPDGKKFLISDLSNIETRNIAWLSGCRLLMEAFSTGRCPYKQFASKIYTRPEESIEKGSQERQLGKVAVLGLGYQMGGPKFQTTAAGPPYNIQLSDGMASNVVKLYRTTYPEVPAFWCQCETAFMEAIKTKGTVPCGRVAFGATKNWGWVVLPSGRPIWFREPKIERVPNPWRPGSTRLQLSYMGLDQKTRQWTRRHTYGGSLAESISQGMAGCLLQAIITRCEANGLPVILTVHDEVVCEVDESESVDRFHEIVKARPVWCRDLPIECESHEAVRYGK